MADQISSGYVDYQRELIRLTGDLRDLQRFCEEHKLEAAEMQTREVIQRIEESSFSVAVVGEFKRGKSTFINALLGSEVLPSDVLPCSATLNRVTYGMKPAVRIRFHDGEDAIIGISDLPAYVTKLSSESEQVAARVREAVVAYPTPFCERNVDIIDTPGLGDDQSMTDITLSVVRNVDVAIMVISAVSPFSEAERRFLGQCLLAQDLGRVIFVVNAIDLLKDSEEVERVMGAIRERIKAALPVSDCSDEFESTRRLAKMADFRVFPISARLALKAKTQHDPEMLKTSGFRDFESYLHYFLAEERGSVFLQVPTNRVLSVGRELMATINLKVEHFKGKIESVKSPITAIRGGMNAISEQVSRLGAGMEGERQQIHRYLEGIEGRLALRQKEAAHKVLASKAIKPADIPQATSLLTGLLSSASEEIRSEGHRVIDPIVGEFISVVSNREEILDTIYREMDELFVEVTKSFGLSKSQETFNSGRSQRPKLAASVKTRADEFLTDIFPVLSADNSPEDNRLETGFVEALGTLANNSWGSKSGFLSQLAGEKVAAKVASGMQKAREKVAADFQKSVDLWMRREIDRQLTVSNFAARIGDLVEKVFDDMGRVLASEERILRMIVGQFMSELQEYSERVEGAAAVKIDGLDQTRRRTKEMWQHAQALSIKLHDFVSPTSKQGYLVTEQMQAKGAVS